MYGQIRVIFKETNIEIFHDSINIRLKPRYFFSISIFDKYNKIKGPQKGIISQFDKY